MQLAQRQKIFADVASLVECAAPKHRERALKLVETVRQELCPEDKRQGPKSDAHRAKIAAAWEDRRNREMFRIEYPELNNRSVTIVGFDNLMKLTRFTMGSIRVRFSTNRGTMPFTYRGADLVAVRTHSMAAEPDDKDAWKAEVDRLIRD